jgi:hypothetical protein
MRIITCLLVWLCANTALSQGTMDMRWQLTLQGAATQCSFNVPYDYLTDSNATWSLDGVADLRVADPVDGHSNYQLEWATGIVIGTDFWSFGLGLADWNIDRTFTIGGGPASVVDVDVALWGVRDLYRSSEGYWEVRSYAVPEPGTGALVVLGLLTWCLQRKLAGSPASSASVAER